MNRSADRSNDTPDAPPGKPALSAIVITKNEAHDIHDCLASLQGWVDEILVLDSGSTDGTQALARALGATVIDTDWPGFGPQKQRALDAARGPWIFSLDADERVTPALRDEILAVVRHPQSQTQPHAPADIYRIPRSSNYCGTWIRHSGWSPDYVVRLFKRDRARFSADLVHERVIAADGAVQGTLTQALIHYSFRDFSEVLSKIDSYSSYGATQGAARGKRGSLRSALLHGLWAFVRTYVVQRGFLDGRMGLVLAISNAEGTYYRYLKLMLIAQQSARASGHAVDRKSARRPPMKDMLISVVISTYNRPDALERVLAASIAQYDPSYELIVADDGSTDATRETVARAAESSPVHIEHVWHPDEGFRVSTIRNKGIARARGDYIIFLDGDCVPQHDFVMRHRMLASAGAIVTGSRILLDEALTREVMDRQVSLPDQSAGFWLRQRLGGHANKVAPIFVKLPDRSWRQLDRFKWRGIKGCNMSAWHSDLERVNGFDENFVGWGHEDADLVVRLANCGVHRKLGAYATEIFHLWHRENTRDQAASNYERVRARLADGSTRAERGLAELPA